MERKRIICSVPLLGVLALALAGCGTGTPNGGTLTSALDNSAWSASQWISAKNAPVVTGPVQGANERRY